MWDVGCGACRGLGIEFSHRHLSELLPGRNPEIPWAFTERFVAAPFRLAYSNSQLCIERTTHKQDAWQPSLCKPLQGLVMSIQVVPSTKKPPKHNDASLCMCDTHILKPATSVVKRTHYGVREGAAVRMSKENLKSKHELAGRVPIKAA
jgi:hypothetical protein